MENRKRKVVVVGEGRNAIGVARYAAKGGSKATVLFERSEQDLSSIAGDINRSKAEGIEFIYQVRPLESIVDRDGKESGIICEELMELNPDEKGNVNYVPLYESEFELEADKVIEVKKLAIE